MKSINENTAVSIGLLVLLLAGSLWLGGVQSLGSQNAVEIREMKTKIEESSKAFEEVRIRLTKLEVLLRRALHDEEQ